MARGAVRYCLEKFRWVTLRFTHPTDSYPFSWFQGGPKGRGILLRKVRTRRRVMVRAWREAGERTFDGFKSVGGTREAVAKSSDGLHSPLAHLAPPGTPSSNLRDAKRSDLSRTSLLQIRTSSKEGRSKECIKTTGKGQSPW